MRKLIFGMQLVDSISQLLTIYYDSSFAICFSQSHKNSSFIKHFDVKLLFAREKIVGSQTCLVHIFREHMLTDLLTKGLPMGVFQNYVTHLGLVKSFLM